MKKILLATFGFLCFNAFSQKLAKTADGEAFLIYPNGTWKQAPKDSVKAIPPVAVHFSAVMSAAAEKPVLIRHAYYEIGYSTRYRVPYWTYYHLNKAQVSHDTLNRTGSFVSDPQTAAPQGTDGDYKGMGYDKGHMVPCEDMSFDEEAMKETFYYSNCVPQTSKLNRGQWKNLEQLTRNWAIDNEGIDVFSGAVITKSLPTLGATGIAIPKTCYKIVLDYTKPGIKAIAFVMPNQDEALDDPQTYACSIDQVEALTGIDFFPELPDELEKTLEASFDPTAWNWNISAHKPKPGQAGEEATEPSGTAHAPVKNIVPAGEPVTVQCSATTQKGERCKRMTTSPNGKCSQHGGN